MLPWYWWLTLGILVGWLAEWLIDVVCWRTRRRKPLTGRIEELEGSLDECHRRVAHLRGEIEQRELRLADLDRTVGIQGSSDVTIRTTDVPLSAAPPPTTVPTVAQLDVADAEPAPAGLEEPEPSSETEFAEPAPPDEIVAEEIAIIDEPAPSPEEPSPDTDEAAAATDDVIVAADEPEPAPEETTPHADEASPEAEHVAAPVGKVIMATDEPEPEPDEVTLQLDEASPEVDETPREADEPTPGVEQLQLPEPAVRPPPPVVTTARAPKPGDDLTLIRGIGSKLAEALAAAGMTSFTHLAEADEEELRSIIQAPDWRRLSYSDWIDQAKVLSAAPPPRTRDDLTLIEGVGPKFAQLLREAGITTFAQLARCDEQQLQAVIDAPPWQRVDYGMWIEQARLIQADHSEGLTALQERLHRRASHNLAPVTGIGPSSVEALEETDISSFAEQASTEEATPAASIEDASLPSGDYAGWSEEARLQAEGKPVSHSPKPEREAPSSPATIPAQDLAAIRGIGPVFEQKFYEGGIGTYAQLSGLSSAEIRAIIQPEEWQDFDYESWIRQARRFAEETNTTGAVWNGIIPDDLSTMRGIGEVIEQKLYEAGILSYADLATATVEQLRAIVQPEEWQRLDFEGWIAQARDLAS